MLGRERLKDDLDAMVPAAHAALERADLTVVIGGFLGGRARLLARAMFEPAGLELVFSKVMMKPGKPVARPRGGAASVLACLAT